MLALILILFGFFYWWFVGLCVWLVLLVEVVGIKLVCCVCSCYLVVHWLVFGSAVVPGHALMRWVIVLDEFWLPVVALVMGGIEWCGFVFVFGVEDVSLVLPWAIGICILYFFFLIQIGLRVLCLEEVRFHLDVLLLRLRWVEPRLWLRQGFLN